MLRESLKMSKDIFILNSTDLDTSIAKLGTEQCQDQHANLDTYSTADLISAFVDDQFNAVRSVVAANKIMASVVDAAVPRLHAGGRIIYVGAGTSGRLGQLDCFELNPTFSWPQDRSLAQLAGGSNAQAEEDESAEDSADSGASELLLLNPGPYDLVFLIAASGRTLYVLGALHAARSAGSLTVAVVNNIDSPIGAAAEYAVVLDTGPEVISGSTRLKAGTAQKIALNTLSSAIMVRLNKVYGHLMVEMRPTNKKLVQRAIQLTMQAAHVPFESAKLALEQSNLNVKTAIVALSCGVTTQLAQEKLDFFDGSVRAAIRKC
jgi:N-acetylmuramic acid 6-phosphate etherase